MMQQDNSKWETIQDCITKCLRLRQGTQDEAIRDRLAKLADKMDRARVLASKLNLEDTLLKKQCLGLGKEKHLYVQKLRKIEEMGDKLEWEQEILARVRPFIDATKRRLKEAHVNRLMKTHKGEGKT